MIPVDGKSTLIGRLLYDTKTILADQLAAVERTSQKRATPLDLSLLTDGLVVEREQGVTGPLCRQPRHGQLHPDRRSNQQYRGGRLIQ